MADEIGYQSSSLPGWGDISGEANETNPDLIWPRSVEVFDKMRKEDSQVGSVLRAVTLPIRSAQWSLDPAGADPEVVKFVSDELGLPIKGQKVEPPLRTRGRFSWDDHLRLALLELVFGHSFFEQVYAVDGGRAHLRKIAWRPPRTISKINVAADGGLVSIEQHGRPGQSNVVISVDRLVVYVNDREGANWLGTSLLRQAYKNWMLKDRLLRAQAIVIERNSLGIPVYTSAPAPDQYKDEAAVKEWNNNEIKEGLKVVRNLRSGSTAGVAITAKAKLELMGVTGTLPKTAEPIAYHDEQIARAMLAHFLNLGSETGSWALGTTFADFFSGSLNATGKHFRDVTQQHVIEDLVDLNWGTATPSPRLTFEPIGSEYPATAEAIKLLIECGALTPDDPVEAYVRDRYGLPAKDPSTSRAQPEPDPDSDGSSGSEQDSEETGGTE